MNTKSAAHTPWFMDTSLHIYGTDEPRDDPEFPGIRRINQPHVATAVTHANAAAIARAEGRS